MRDGDIDMHNIDKRKQKILDIIRKNKHITMEEIATMLYVTSRTIRHDIGYLRTQNYGIVIKRGNQGGVFLVEKEVKG